MLILITGGSGSGKSSFAENKIAELRDRLLSMASPDSQQLNMYYIATMQVYGEEGHKKVERHRRLRAGKGFITLEQTVDVDQCLERRRQQAEDTKPCPEAESMCSEAECFSSEAGNQLMTRDSSEPAAIALLECMSNLVANEMFSLDGIRFEEEVVEKVSREVLTLAEKLDALVIVTNNVFEDGIIYDNSTMAYIRALGRINQAIAAEADEVWESVAGIPVRLK